MKPKDVIGKVVVLTGKFSELKRDEAEAALAKLGATIGSGITKNTDILFAGEKAGSKLAKAQQLGVAIHDEATLVAVLAGIDAKAAAAEADTTAPTKATPVAAFAGKNIVLTGTFATMKRNDAARVLAEAGATIGSSVSKTTNLLIHGADAGSKLDKALALGIAMMTEEEMVALLAAGGAGASELAGADEKLAKKQEATAAETTEMTAVAAELRKFVAALKTRPDIRVEVANVGRKASKSDVAYVRALNDELADFYAEMNGIHVEWRFVEPDGGGCLRVPPVSQWTKFTGEDKHYMGFGDQYEALLLDEITPEGNTWLVREVGKMNCRIVFGSAAEGADGVEPARTIAEYLTKAMDNGFCHYWPRCGVKHQYVSYAEQEAALARFKETPKKPGKLAPKVRVTFKYFSEGGRGEILRTKEIAKSRTTEFYGDALGLVRLDVGGEAWIPFKFMKAKKKEADAYDRLRDGARFDTRNPLAALEEIARAIGPMYHYSTINGIGTIPSNGRRAAGLLATRSLTDAVEAVLDLRAAAEKANLDFSERRTLEKSGDEFDSTDYARASWQWRIDDVFIGLFGGLHLLACYASAAAGGGDKLVPRALVDRVSAVDGATILADILTSKSPSAVPDWGTYADAQALEALGIAEGETLFAGTGY